VQVPAGASDISYAPADLKGSQKLTPLLEVQRKEVKTMKYETPELMVLAPVISAVQTNSQGAKIGGTGEGTHPTVNDDTAAYADWE